MKKSALIALVIILVIAVIGGGLWAVMHFVVPAETDPAAIVPGGARFFVELDATRMSDADLALADEYAAFTKKLIGGEFELPAMKDLAFRGALVVYGSAKLQGMIPGLVIVFHAPKPDAFSPLEEKLLKALDSAEQTERDFKGWTVTEAKQKGPMGAEIYLGLARRGSLRIFATGKTLLEECLDLAEAGKIEGTLAADENFLKAFAGLPFAPPDHGLLGRLKNLASPAPRANQRVYLDLKGIIDDIHPLLSMAGGETYKTIKEKILDHLVTFSATGGPEGDGMRSVSAIKLASAADWMTSLGAAKLEWPGRAPEEAQMMLAMALPERLSEVFGLFINQMSGARGQAQIGQVHGVMGSINGALAMYFADQEGMYPIAATPTSIGDIGIVPKYMAEEPKTAWNESFLYQGDGTTYVISAMLGGETITWYSSASGRVETARNAADLLKTSAEEEGKQIKELLSGIREVGIAMMPGTQRGIEALMTPAFSPGASANQIFAIRFKDAASATAAEAMITPLLPATSVISRRIEKEWILLGETKLVESVRPPGAAAAGTGFLQSRSIFDLAQFVPEERIADLPAAHQWTNTGNGTVDGQTILLESLGAPDPMPAIFGAIGALIHAEKIDFPMPGRSGARNRPRRPVEGPGEPEVEAPAPATE